MGDGLTRGLVSYHEEITKEAVNEFQNPIAAKPHCTNQMIKNDDGKMRISIVPLKIIEAISAVREFGLKKYPEDSWRRVEIERYINATYRHLAKIISKGIDSKDEESGLPHLWHLATNVAFLIEL